MINLAEVETKSFFKARVWNRWPVLFKNKSMGGKHVNAECTEILYIVTMQHLCPAGLCYTLHLKQF